jgi:hypothetical protein
MVTERCKRFSSKTNELTVNSSPGDGVEHRNLMATDNITTIVNDKMKVIDVVKKFNQKATVQ